MTQVNGRIVIDYNTAMECNPGSMEPLVRWADAAPASSATDPEEDHETTRSHVPLLNVADLLRKFKRNSFYRMSDQQALLCPSTVRGYSLKDKCWMDFDIDKVRDIEWDDNCLPKLQMDTIMRDTLASLVSRHIVSGQKRRDVVAEKGKGLTFLFHGPPGSGKTLTAGTLRTTP